MKDRNLEEANMDKERLEATLGEANMVKRDVCMREAWGNNS